VNYRIACSILAILGAVALTQAVEADGAEKLTVTADTGTFGQVLGTSVTITSPIVALATVACPDGNACFWKQGGYDGDRKLADAGDAGQELQLGAYDESMKNRLANRRVQIKDIDLDVLDCINPGGERTNLPLRADIFRIGVSGSSC